MPLPIADTRHLFRPLTADIVALERQLTADDWTRPTMAGKWRVRDVAAHLLDTALRRLSFQRDRHQPPAPAHPIRSDRDVAALVNALNATWVAASDRLSARAIVDLYAVVSRELSDFFEQLPAGAPALFPVSWAGGSAEGLLDVGREFTEVWHHGAQIREAVGAPPFADPSWLRAVLAIAMHALPYAYRDVPGREGDTLAITVTGPAAGQWVLRRAADGWQIDEGRADRPSAAATMPDEIAWRLLFNALPASGHPGLQLSGDLAQPLLRSRSVVV